MSLKEAISRRFSGSGEVETDDLPLEQIETLTERNRRSPDKKVESRLVKLRNLAFDDLSHERPDSAPEMLGQVPEGAKRYEIVDRLPTVDATDVDAEVIRAAFLEAGCLMVRGLIDPERAARLKDGIDRAFDGRDAYIDGKKKVAETAPWFEPFVPAEKYRTTGKEWNRHVKGGGSVWAADSPRVMFEMLDAFEDAGVLQLTEEYLGERPAFSMKKAVLRRVSAESGSAWHQDGAFLGDDTIRTLNVWVALTRCGDEAPGMDIIPKRIDHIVPTGTEGALFDWAVSDALIREQFGAPVRPIFEAGDALLFDHLCLHQTAAEPEMKKLRYATETWCFAPSTYPGRQIPLVV